MSRDSIRQRAEAAKPGPWEWVVDSGSVVLAGSGDATEGHILTVHICRSCWDREQPCMGGLPGDQAFIAHARQDIPALLAASVDEADLDAFEDLLDWHHSAHAARGDTAPARCWVQVCVDNARRLRRLRGAFDALEAMP